MPSSNNKSPAAWYARERAARYNSAYPQGRTLPGIRTLGLAVNRPATRYGDAVGEYTASGQHWGWYNEGPGDYRRS
jgi:hypothetical protein